MMEKNICLYNSDNGAKSIRGVRIIRAESANVNFSPISERVYIMTTKISDNIKFHLINTYSQALKKTMRNLDEACIC